MRSREDEPVRAAIEVLKCYSAIELIPRAERSSYRAAVTVLVLAVEDVGGRLLSPDQLVKQVVETWNQFELCKHSVNLFTRHHIFTLYKAQTVYHRDDQTGYFLLVQFH